MKRVILTILLALNLAVPGFFAASEKGYNSHFGDMDTNNDKGVTWEEFKAFFAHAEQEKFQEADRSLLLCSSAWRGLLILRLTAPCCAPHNETEDLHVRDQDSQGLYARIARTSR